MDYTTGGIRFQLYARRRKRSVRTLICYYVGSQRMMATFRGDAAAAKGECRELAKRVTTGEENPELNLTVMERRIYVLARDACATIGREVDAVCREYVEVAKILGPGASILEAVRDWQSAREQSRPGVSKRDLSRPETASPPSETESVSARPESRCA